MRVALDTNILVYADAGDRSPQDAGKWLTVLDRITLHVAADDMLFIPVQALIELHDVLCRKRNLSREEAVERITSWRETVDVVGTTESVVDRAFDLSSQHRLRIFDAVIVAAAAEARCEMLLSEDLQHGFEWQGVRVVNPFL